MQSEVEHFLDVARRQDGHEEAGEDDVRIARVNRGTCMRVVARNRQHATVLAYAAEVGVAERIGGAVHARRLAVPHAEHTVVPGARHRVQGLRAEYRGGGQFFIQAGLEHDVVVVQVLLVAQHFVVHTAYRRARITRYEPGGVKPVALVQPALVDHQAQQGLHAIEVDPAVLDGVTVVQRQQVLYVGGGIHLGYGRSDLARSASFKQWCRRLFDCITRPGPRIKAVR